MQSVWKYSVVVGIALACSLFLTPKTVSAYSSILKDAGGIVTQTLTKASSPYFVSGGCATHTIPAGRTLTIQAGVVVQFETKKRCGLGNNSSDLLVYGNLTVNGTVEEPVIFTSWRDDTTAAGDANGDGDATVPQPGDWFAIRFQQNGSLAAPQVSMQHVVVRYAEVGLSIGKYTSLSLSDFEFAYNLVGLSASVPSAIHQSDFHHNGTAVRANGTTLIDATENWWGHDSGPKIASNPLGQGEVLSGNVLYFPWVRIAEEKKVPVILVPGILGSELKKGEETLWLDFSELLESTTDSFLDSLLMKPDGTPDDGGVILGDVVREKNYILGTYHYFDELIKEFEKKDYLENKDLFVFPYDWRLDNKIASQKLKEKIDLVIEQTGASKVHVVAHSMGGLVVKQYIVDNEDHHIDKLVFVGTPHLGAPKAFKALLTGDTFGIPLILNPLQMKKLAQNMSSVYQLLPSDQYIQRFGGYFLDIAGNEKNYEETKTYLLNHSVNDALLQNAEEFHNDKMDFFASSGIETFNIMGCNTPTVGRIVQRNAYLEGGKVVEDYDLDIVAGDGTVPLNSALAVTAENRFFATEADHAKMPSQNGSRELIAQIVSGTIDPNALPEHISSDIGKCHIKNGKLVSVHSPVDLHVYDSEGRHVGVGEYESIDLDIPGAVYEDVGHNKFIFLPTDAGQQYDVRLDATATGTFSFRVSTIEDDVKKETVLFNKIAITPQSEALMAVSDTSADTVLAFDSRGTGSLVSLSADAVLDMQEVQDFIKPSTTVRIAGTLGKDGWYRSKVQLAFTAADDNSGILKTEYSIDGGNTWSVASTSLEIMIEGTTDVQYHSIDRAGNMEETQTAVIKIDTIAPEASIVFDPSQKDLVITGIDTASTTVAIVSNVTTITDSAGNTLDLVFEEENRKRALHAHLLSLRYNGVVHDMLALNRFDFKWKYDKKNTVLQLLKQNVNVKKDFHIKGVYTIETGETEVEIKEGKKKRNETRNGLAPFVIQTDKGNFNYSF